MYNAKINLDQALGEIRSPKSVIFLFFKLVERYPYFGGVRWSKLAHPFANNLNVPN